MDRVSPRAGRGRGVLASLLCFSSNSPDSHRFRGLRHSVPAIHLVGLNLASALLSLRRSHPHDALPS